MRKSGFAPHNYTPDMIKAVQGNNRCLFSVTYEAHRDTLLEYCGVSEVVVHVVVTAVQIVKRNILSRKERQG
jgi:hypothetical protein